MDDLLKQFLADGEKLMENAPLDFFYNDALEDKHEPNGIHIVWFIAWCRASDLLSSDFRTAFDMYTASESQSEISILDFCKKYTEGSLKPEHLSPRGASFARKYYGTGWTHRYLEDLEALFPDAESFDQLVDRPENYEAISRIISQRLVEFLRSHASD